MSDDQKKSNMPRPLDPKNRLPEVLPEPKTPQPREGRGWLSRLGLKNNEKAYDAAADVVRARTGLVRAWDDHAKANLELERSMRLLGDAEDIHTQDAAARKTNRIQAEEALKEEELNAEIREWDREARKAEARARYGKPKDRLHTPDMTVIPPEKQHTASPESEGSTPNRAAQEFEDEFSNSNTINANEQRMRLEKRLVDDFGEESKWTERAKKIANDMREELEQYLRDSSAV